MDPDEERKKEMKRAFGDRFDETMSRISFLAAVHPNANSVHPELNQDTPSIANISQYEYTSLDYDKKEIRILLVAPAGKWEDPIQCALFTEPLDDIRFPFTALSYCWGDSKATIPMFIDGCVHQITTNVASFLRQRRLPTEPSVYWIDALCINQSDNKEKEQQVGMMRSIYQHAFFLMIWLGDETDDSNLAMDLVRRLGRPGEEKSKVWIMDDEEILALENFFQRKWWNRIWIVQELVNGGSADDARTRIVMCGWTALPWAYIARAVARLKHHNRDTRQYFRYLKPILGLESARKAHGSSIGGSSDLLQLLELHRGRQATDPRDKVYGIMGLSNPNEPIYRGIDIDYGQSAPYLFATIVQYAITATNSLEVLRRCHRSGIPNMPTWVADWSVSCNYKPLRTRYTISLRDSEEGEEHNTTEPKRYYNAAKSSTPNVHVSENKKVLSVAGFIFEKIQVIHDPFPENVTEPWENSTHFMNIVARCKAASLGSRRDENPYPTTEATTAAFWHTLFADHTGDNQYPASLYAALEHISKEYEGLQDWLSPIPGNWNPRLPRVTETSTGRLHAGAWGARISKFFSGPDFQTEAEGVGMGMDFLPSTWSLEQLEQHTKEFIALGKTWEHGHYDLIKSPFHLPNVIPDPFLHHRRPDTAIALLYQASSGLPGAHQYALGRRFIMTEKGYMGLAPPECQEGDDIAVLFGGDVPFVLRRRIRDAREFELVGEVHVQGIMDGEAMQLLDAGQLESQTFQLV